MKVRKIIAGFLISVVLACLAATQGFHPSEMGLLEAGFVGGTNPVESDSLYRLNLEENRADKIIWFNTTDKTWRFTTAGFPKVPTGYFQPDDKIIINTRVSRKKLLWRNGKLVTEQNKQEK